MGGTADGGHMVTQAVPDDLVTVREAAQVVGVSPQTVYGWIVSGRLMASGPPGPPDTTGGAAGVRRGPCSRPA